MTQPLNKPTSKSELLKFRPVFTEAQLRHLAVLCEYDLLHSDLSVEDNLSLSIKRIIVPMISKIEVGAISPSHKLSEHAALKRFKAGQDEAYMNGTMTSEEEKEYEHNTLGL